MTEVWVRLYIWMIDHEVTSAKQRIYQYTTCFAIVSQALRENTYPFLAMIMLKDRKMTVVGRLEGLIQPEDFINQLTFIMDANQTHLMSERLER